MPKKLNPNAKVFVPRPVPQSSSSSSTEPDVIYLIRNGKVQTIQLTEPQVSNEERPRERPRDDCYRGNALRSDHSSKDSTQKVYADHFYGWTFNQIASFIRSSPKEVCLDALYEAVRQRVHLNCLGVLIVYAVQKGESLEECEERVWEAFGRFFPQSLAMEYDTSHWLVTREIQWARTTL